MPIMEKGHSLLTEQLFTNNAPVSYKYLSRSLGLHTSEAKRILAEFYESFKEEHKELSRSFIVIGKPKDSVSQATTLIKIFTGIKKEEDFNSQRDQIFETIYSCNYYGLSPSESTTAENLVNSTKAIIESLKLETTPENLEKWGTIKPAHVIEKSQDQGPISLASQSQFKKESSAAPSTMASTLRSKTDPSGSSSKTSTTANTDFFASRYVSRKLPKQESTKPSQSSSNEEPKTSSFSYKSRKSEPKPSKVVIDSNNDDIMELDDDSFSETKTKTKVINKKDNELKVEHDKKLSGLFDDDEEDFEFSDDLNSQKDEGVDSVEPEELKQDLDEKATAQETKSASTVATMMKKHAEKVRSESKEIPEPEPEPTEQYYDEEGYLVTRIKEAPKPKAKPTKRANTEPAPKKHTIDVSDSKSSADAKKKKSTQTSLMNFFGSKKK